MTGALVWGSQKRALLELVSLARGLGLSPIHALAVGLSLEEIREVARRGPDRVFSVSLPSDRLRQPDALVHVLCEGMRRTGSLVLLLPATRRGKEVAPRVAYRMGLACVTGALSVRREGEGLEFDRSILGGKATATERPTTRGVVATVAPRLAEPLPESSKEAPTETWSLELPPSRVRTVEERPRSGKGVHLEDAPVVVGAGRGVRRKEDLALLEELAKTLGGEIGCSRPLATDLGWLSDEHWIGLSGKEIRPRLYIAVGISGQIQHTTGIRGSKLIVAINTNKDAPIFKVCDYGIVGDLYRVVPALTEALRKELGRT